MSNFRAFRPLNENEIRCLHKHTTEKSPIAPDTVSDIKVYYSGSQGGFTVCIIKRTLTDDESILLSGASRRSYKDKPDRLRGEMLAFRRAIKTRPIIL